MSGFSPLRSSVQTPRGPRKSGIPAEVEMPAPVCTTTCFACRIQSVSKSTLFKSALYGTKRRDLY